MNKPELNKEISVNDFKDFYWLKEELVLFCKSYGINRSGSKTEISNRILKFLEKGEVVKESDINKEKTISKFDWNNEILSPDTIITDNYKNSENVRTFFTEKIGKHFRFNTEFMNWMKQNPEKTLQDAIDKWINIYNTKKDKSIKTEIAPQFEYNRYIRDFLKDNPDKSHKDAVKFWKLKKSLRGTNEYSRSDLDL